MTVDVAGADSSERRVSFSCAQSPAAPATSGAVLLGLAEHLEEAAHVLAQGEIRVLKGTSAPASALANDAAGPCLF